MNKKTRMFIAAFAITAILIGALCGFAAVDLSTERYMPDRFGPFFEIYGIGLTGVDFAFMSEDYRLDFGPLGEAGRVLGKYRGLLPQGPRAAAALAAAGAERVIAGIGGGEMSVGAE